MIVLKNDKILPVDIDGTLIEYMPKHEVVMKGDIITLYGGKSVHLRPMTMNIALMKHKRETRGYYIMVWSANGKEWAAHILRELRLEQYVDVVLTKPKEYVDDKPVQEWMTNRIHLEEI